MSGPLIAGLCKPHPRQKMVCHRKNVTPPRRRNEISRPSLEIFTTMPSQALVAASDDSHVLYSARQITDGGRGIVIDFQGMDAFGFLCAQAKSQSCRHLALPLAPA